MSFDHFENKLIIQDYKQNEILSMFYSNKYRLISRNSRGFLPITYTYRDNDQKLLSWKIGSYYEEFLYDTRGRLIEIQRFNELSSIKYSYGNGEQVNLIDVLSSGTPDIDFAVLADFPSRKFFSRSRKEKIINFLCLFFLACWNHIWFSIECYVT
jgi:hypothetical protein